MPSSIPENKRSVNALFVAIVAVILALLALFFLYNINGKVGTANDDHVVLEQMKKENLEMKASLVAIDGRIKTSDAGMLTKVTALEKMFTDFRSSTMTALVKYEERILKLEKNVGSLQSRVRALEHQLSELQNQRQQQVIVSPPQQPRQQQYAPAPIYQQAPTPAPTPGPYAPQVIQQQTQPAPSQGGSAYLWHPRDATPHSPKPCIISGGDGQGLPPYCSGASVQPALQGEPKGAWMIRVGGGGRFQDTGVYHKDNSQTPQGPQPQEEKKGWWPFSK